MPLFMHSRRIRLKQSMPQTDEMAIDSRWKGKETDWRHGYTRLKARLAHGHSPDNSALLSPYASRIRSAVRV